MYRARNSLRGLARHRVMTLADLLVLALYAAARETLETQAGARRIRAAGGNMFNRRNQINVWSRRVRERIEA